jgi:hypothetical protein
MATVNRKIEGSCSPIGGIGDRNGGGIGKMGSYTSYWRSPKGEDRGVVALMPDRKVILSYLANIIEIFLGKTI